MVTIIHIYFLISFFFPFPGQFCFIAHFFYSFFIHFFDMRMELSSVYLNQILYRCSQTPTGNSLPTPDLRSQEANTCHKFVSNMVRTFTYMFVAIAITLCNCNLIGNRLEAHGKTRIPSLPANYKQMVLTNLQQQCDRCRLCDFGSYPVGVHPCESFICKNSAMSSKGICSGCKDYTHCNTSCKGLCYLLPLLNSAPTRRGNHW